MENSLLNIFIQYSIIKKSCDAHGVFRQGSQTMHVMKLIYFTLKFKTSFYLLLYEDLFRKKMYNTNIFQSC